MGIKLSLKNKIIAATTLAIVLGSGIGVYTAYKIQYKRTEVATDGHMEKASVALNNSFSDWVENKRAITNAVPEGLSGQPLVDALIQARISGKFDDIYFGTPTGEMTRSRPERNKASYDPRTRPWYISTMDARQAQLTEPYQDAITNQYIVTITKLSLGGINGVRGVFGADVPINDLIHSLSTIVLPAKGYAFLINSKGNIFAHTDQSLIGDSIETTGVQHDVVKGVLTAKKHKHIFIKGKEWVVYAKAVKGTDLVTVTVMDNDDNLANLNKMISDMVVTNILIALACAIIITLVCSYLFRPLVTFSTAFKRIVDGDLTKGIDVKSNDEIGDLAREFNSFVDGLNETVKSVVQKVEDINRNSQASLASNNQAKNSIAEQQSQIDQVATAVTEMASATQEISQHADNAAQAAQASASNTIQGLDLAMKAKDSMGDLSEKMSEAGAVIDELDQHTSDIAKVLSTIREIAEQTNLLALNAAIEAARAGEQGRGFAVVADEVRVLSQRTHKSTEEINSTIEILQNISKRSVAIMKESSQAAVGVAEDVNQAAMALDEINSSVAVISDMSAQIATAAQEQTYVNEEVNANIIGVKDATDSLVHVATDVAQQANDLSAQSAELNQIVSVFKV